MADRDTLEFYDREAATYTADTTPKDLPKAFHDFAARLSPGSDLLDLGCGGGWAAAGFRDLGHRVLAMDASEGMISEVARRGGIETRLGGFDRLEDTATFDAIWASFSLQHAPREDMPDNLARIGRALRTPGWFYLGIHEGEETLRDDLGRLYCHYQVEELHNLLLNAGLAPISLSREKSTGYDGRPIECLHIEAVKNG